MKKIIIIAAIILISQSVFSQKDKTKDKIKDKSDIPAVFLVEFETTKGNFTVEINKEWSPLGAERFYELVTEKYYDSIPIFRVVKNFVAQFGISNDPGWNDKLEKNPIKDEPVKASNLKGVISFARSGVDTRSNQVFINLKDNTRLDTVTYGGVTGFPPIGKIIKGIEVIDKLNSEYGEAPNQDSITVKGSEYTKRNFPNMDYIIRAAIK